MRMDLLGPVWSYMQETPSPPGIRFLQSNTGRKSPPQAPNHGAFLFSAVQRGLLPAMSWRGHISGYRLFVMGVSPPGRPESEQTWQRRHPPATPRTRPEKQSSGGYLLTRRSAKRSPGKSPISSRMATACTCCQSERIEALALEVTRRRQGEADGAGCLPGREPDRSARSP